VPNQHLDHADIRLLFEQVCRETAAQGMHEYALVDARGLGGMSGAVQLSRAERGTGIEPGK
jgi:hypothetical protein